MNKLSQGEVVKVSGPLVIAKGMRDADMFDVVEVSKPSYRRDHRDAPDEAHPAYRRRV